MEDIAATQAEHTALLTGIVERLDKHTTLLKRIETALQLLAGDITNMRTELLEDTETIHQFVARQKNS